MPNGTLTYQTSSATAYFQNIFIGEGSVSFTAVFVNNSSVNVHTYQVATSWNTVSNGNVPQSSTIFVPGSSPFLGYTTDGFVEIVKYGPNFGILGSASFGFTTGTPSAPPPPPPPPPTPAPVFSDTTVANGVLGVFYSDGVLANNTSSYAIASGSLPSGLSLNTSSGAITGTPTQQESFTFAITASGAGGSTSSGNLTIQIFPAGNRRNDLGFDTNLSNAKRYDGAAWVNLSTMKRFDGTNWINISN